MSATGLVERALEVPLGGVFRVDLGGPGGELVGYPEEVLALVERCHDACIFQAVARGGGVIQLEGSCPDLEIRVGDERSCPPLRAMDLCL